jgi:hypothetical protein|tara:strand:- start:272 stop:457 length:186 start_codon:yes stop_codon:yes gene_type:complete
MKITINIDLDKDSLKKSNISKETWIKVLEETAKDAALLQAFQAGIVEKGSFQETYCKINFG